MADSIKIGNLDISSFKVGSADCKVYLGDVLLYPQSVSYKLIAQYSDTSEYKVECDGNAVLTAAEVSAHTTPKSAMTSAIVGSCDGQGSFKIGDNAFYGASAMTSVTIDNAVTEIGQQSFMGCSGLTSFTFPSGLTKINGSTFRLCNQITSINVPNGVRYIGSGAFADMAGLTGATIPATLTGASTNLFLRDINLKEVHFEGTTPPALGADAFKGCTALSKIYIPSCDSYDAYAANAKFSAYTDLIYAEDETKCAAHDYSADYFTIVADGNCTINLSNLSNGVRFDYSTSSGSSWEGFNLTSFTVSISSGNSLLVKGRITGSTSNGIGRFSSTGKFHVEGNIRSLTNYTDFSGGTELNRDYEFSGLFSGCTGMTSAENLILPAKSSTTNCYEYMFQKCTSLEKPPKIELTKMAGVSQCFYMFHGCSKLKYMPDLLPTNLSGANSCYSAMFSGCTSLTAVTSLPATTLSTGCYSSMFAYCSGLTTIQSSLPATTLSTGCYSSMFAYCSNITTAPVLPATTLVKSCYNRMFNYCSKLNYVKAMFTTTPSTTYTNSWLYNVASNGTFVKNSSATWTTRGTSAVPNNWTIQTASS